MAIVMTTLLAACSPIQGSGEDECPDDAACAPVATVPDVEHTELRAAWRALVAEGYNVEFTRTLVHEGYESYVLDDSKGMSPEPWVGDVDPEPGTRTEEGETVTVTAIECPNQMRHCD